MIFDLLSKDSPEAYERFRYLASVYGLPSRQVSPQLTAACLTINYNVTGGGSTGFQYFVLNEAPVTSISANAVPTPQFFYWGSLECAINVYSTTSLGLTVNKYGYGSNVQAIYNSNNIVTNTNFDWKAVITSFQYVGVSANNSGGVPQTVLISFMFNGYKVYCA
jgi:hypothetical protein